MKYSISMRTSVDCMSHAQVLMLTFVIINGKLYKTIFLNGRRDFEKALKSTVTANLVVTFLYHPANPVPLSKSRCNIIDNAVCSQNHTALFSREKTIGYEVEQ